jgi:Holliday junction resolvase RusA-like endonuclease
MTVRTFIIPGAPVAKARARVTRYATFTPKRTLDAQAHALACYLDSCGSLPPFDGPVSVDCRFVFPVAKSWSKAKKAAALSGELRHTQKPDIDNLAKLVTDSINERAYADDAQIVALLAHKLWGNVPATYVTLEEAT